MTQKFQAVFSLWSRLQSSCPEKFPSVVHLTALWAIKSHYSVGAIILMGRWQNNMGWSAEVTNDVMMVDHTPVI